MRVYAFESEDNFYSINVDSASLNVFNASGGLVFSETVHLTVNDNIYHYNNPVLSGIDNIQWIISESSDPFTFPYNVSVYDYYFLGTLVAYCSDDSNSTWKPTKVYAMGYNVDSSSFFAYPRSEENIYNIDSDHTMGFGFSQKIEFDQKNNIGISGIWMGNDKDGTGIKPAGLMAEFGILAVPIGTDEAAISQQILNKLSEMESSISGSIDAAGDKVADAIENQYAVSDTEDFGVGQIADQVEEKLGVLSFGADTLNNFLGLFQASNAGSTVLTFPGFTIDVQGESYQVWNDIQFDLSFLEENFGFLIDTVRTVTVLCVWLAVLGYLVKAYEHLVNNKG